MGGYVCASSLIARREATNCFLIGAARLSVTYQNRARTYESLWRSNHQGDVIFKVLIG